MKKIWKNLCVFSMALACGMGVVGCGDKAAWVSKDLDGDGGISSWETIFQSNEGPLSESKILGEIKYIKNAQDLLDINNQEPQSEYSYVLSNDIDLGGKTVSINLGASSLYGNGYSIRNFKLDCANLKTTGNNNNRPVAVYSLFRGGVNIQDVNIFMGYQNIEIAANNIGCYYVSPFFNVTNINNVSVKGKLDINIKRIDGEDPRKLRASLLHTVIGTQDENIEESVKQFSNITSIGVDGVINVSQEKESNINTIIGGTVSELRADSLLYDVHSSVTINMDHSNGQDMVGGVVGNNYGFLSTCVATGDINISGKNNSSGEVVLGGIAGYNGVMAELKNTSNNMKINCTNDDTLEAAIDKAVIIAGGTVGINNCGVVEYAQSDAELTISDYESTIIGGLSGQNQDGIISYALCRGKIVTKEVNNVCVAQVSGQSTKGLIEKVVTNTAINVVNLSDIESVDVGMVTTFTSGTHDDSKNSPYFRRILVDGITEVEVKSKNYVTYNLGLRNKFQVAIDTDEEGNTIYETRIPDVYDKLFYIETGCKFFLYENVNSVKQDVSPTITYAKSQKGTSYVTGTSTVSSSWMTNRLDFKNYLNHNEVNISGSSINLNNLYFTLSESQRLNSYFGNAQYNGELAYFDTEFSTSYKHNPSASGGCENDKKDEFMSFIYELVTNSTNGMTVIKLDKDFLVLPEENESSHPYVDAFVSNISESLKCLSVIPTIELLSENKTNMEDETETLDPKYISVKFDHKSSRYTMLFDISNLLPNRNDMHNSHKFFVYLQLTINTIVGA